MHSSRMHTARLLTVFRSIPCRPPVGRPRGSAEPRNPGCRPPPLDADPLPPGCRPPPPDADPPDPTQV